MLVKVSQNSTKDRMTNFKIFVAVKRRRGNTICCKQMTSALRLTS